MFLFIYFALSDEVIIVIFWLWLMQLLQILLLQTLLYTLYWLLMTCVACSYDSFVSSRGGNFSDGLRTVGKRVTLA